MKKYIVYAMVSVCCAVLTIGLYALKRPESSSEKMETQQPYQSEMEEMWGKTPEAPQTGAEAYTIGSSLEMEPSRGLSHEAWHIPQQWPGQYQQETKKDLK